jgi:hypothetical protein
VRKLERDELARVVRELDDSPALVRWLADSRDENRVLLEGSPAQDLPGLQGQNNSLNQILDKVPKT